jgi:hypothetical protein
LWFKYGKKGSVKVAEMLEPYSPDIKFQANMWLDTATEMGMGTNQATRIDFIEQTIN